MREMRKRGREKRADQKDLDNELAKIERAAMRQYMKDDASGSSAQPAAAVPADRAARLAELEQKIETTKLLARGGGALPDGWRMVSNPDGRIFYMHNQTGKLPILLPD